ncbi:hypothetical protein SCLCIDRAFT_1224730 [Scleroderma citrinum Foug A]|uniref:Uncharacterized protein n=1 Tax=Scleroderma citrinum Foug A TaxID=1036808 RepID=A0A0C3CRI1_9AGAM|nr:hypothetical protein SCLCIDRAFT_1224730 [Scleroderma citrinum Foug A]
MQNQWLIATETGIARTPNQAHELNSERTVIPSRLRIFDFAHSQTEEALGHMTWCDMCTRTSATSEMERETNEAIHLESGNLFMIPRSNTNLWILKFVGDQ